MTDYSEPYVDEVRVAKVQHIASRRIGYASNWPEEPEDQVVMVEWEDDGRRTTHHVSYLKVHDVRLLRRSR